MGIFFLPIATIPCYIAFNIYISCSCIFVRGPFKILVINILIDKLFSKKMFSKKMLFNKKVFKVLRSSASNCFVFHHKMLSVLQTL